MITKIIHGMRAYRPRPTAAGLYCDIYRVAEMTGRKLDVLTVVPDYVWGKPESPCYTSLQLPAKDLLDEHQFQQLAQGAALHPAMLLAAKDKTTHAAP
jgi:hypothetical protein